MNLEIIYLLLISLAINWALFIPAFIFKTDKLTDMSYSISFIALILAAFFLNITNDVSLLLTVMIVVWGMRLGVFLLIRIWKMDRDKRFDGIRESFFRFFKFWSLQAFAVWAILLPALLFILAQGKEYYSIGFFIWLLGLLIEGVADKQKYKFKQDKKNKDKFISTGIWKYSRHPNYFGEMLIWVGIFVFVLPSLSTTSILIGLISPLFIILLLSFGTGIPPLEKYADKKWGKDKKYKEYKRRTSILVPWFPKKD